MVLTKGIFIVAAKRTPFGTYGGKFVKTSATDLGEVAAKAALAAGNVNPEIIDHVIFGNGRFTSPHITFLARHVALRAGIPIEKPAYGLNRLCGSGFQSIVSGSQSILVGESKVVLAGGVDNMSQAPFVVRNFRSGAPLGTSIQFEDSLWAGFTDSYCKLPMAMTAEKLGAKFNISREQVDKYGLRSQQMWKKAADSGVFDQEIAPVKVMVKRKEEEVKLDEHPRPQTTIEGLNKLPPIFQKDGLVTAGTASGICDGAGAVIVASEQAVSEYKLTPLARLVGYTVVGVDPSIMGIGPSPAIKQLLKEAGKSLDDIDIVEINEAFAAQVLACAKDLNLDINKLNLNGGAIALGHPLGASGSRITAHIVHELRRTNKKLGIGSACIGGGQGIALLLEKC
ncbi:3-ketoacyl-CoA thiolase, mitochondrial-like [Planococcus citri]|uniref:3-ketoacyl-CoA thiolase, mitochondrial-like n=1 Tax=Planococcus citri TaxID=170843 RepID=UPI0031F74AF7